MCSMLAGAPSGSSKSWKADRGIEIKPDPARLPARLPSLRPSRRPHPCVPCCSSWQAAVCWRPEMPRVWAHRQPEKREGTPTEREKERERTSERERESLGKRERARARARARTSERGWNASFGSWQHLGICSKLEIAVQQRGITTIDLTGSAVKNLESVTCTNSAYLYYSLNR